MSIQDATCWAIITIMILLVVFMAAIVIADAIDRARKDHALRKLNQEYEETQKRR